MLRFDVAFSALIKEEMPLPTIELDTHTRKAMIHWSTD